MAAFDRRFAPADSFFPALVRSRKNSESRLFMKPRRTFLLRCSTVAAGAVVMPGAVLGTPSLSQGGPAHPGLAEFEKNLNSSFEVIHEGGSKVTLKLVEAQAARRRSSSKAVRGAADAGNEKFSLLFKGPRNQLLPQDTYRFRHRELGELSLFIVPVLSRNQRHYAYEAIFNRPRGMKLAVT
jgi:hypothetical protein